MTVVIALQILLAALAGLLLLETRVRRDERRRRDGFETADVDFHPELIVAWDDEANYARRRQCTRSMSGHQREPHRPALVAARPRIR